MAYMHTEAGPVVLAGLARMDRPAWEAMVRWAAPQLCKEDPGLLIEIVCQEAARRLANECAPPDSLPEIIAAVLAECDLRLAVAESEPTP